MAQDEAPEVVILGTDGTEHVFPPGFDPKRAAQIVRQQTLKAANAAPLTEPSTYGAGVLKSVGDTAARTGSAVWSTMNPINIAKGFGEAVKAHGTATPGYSGPPLPPVSTQLKEALTSLTTPEGGGHAIGNLLLAFAAGRAPKVAGAAREKMYTGGQSLRDLAQVVQDETAGTYHPMTRAAQFGLRTGGRLLQTVGKRPVPPIPDLPVPPAGVDWRTAVAEDAGGLETSGGRPLAVSAPETPAYVQQQLQDELLRRAPGPEEARTYSPVSGATRIPITPPPRLGAETLETAAPDLATAKTGELARLLQSPDAPLRAAAEAELRRRGLLKGQ